MFESQYKKATNVTRKRYSEILNFDALDGSANRGIYVDSWM